MWETAFYLWIALNVKKSARCSMYGAGPFLILDPLINAHFISDDVVDGLEMPSKIIGSAEGVFTTQLRS